MIRAFALATVFAISLFAIPTTPTTKVIPTPTCDPNCLFPWE